MTETDWLSLTSAEDLYGELAAVAQPRKLFQLGTAFLTRVWDLLPADDVKEAVTTTRAYIGGRADVVELRAAWSRAEMATGDGIWANDIVQRDYYGHGRWDCHCRSGGCPECCLGPVER